MKRDHFIFYGWFIVGTGILSYALAYGARYSFSVIFTSLLEEFQWPRDTTALMFSVHMLVYGLVAPLAGSLVDRIGPRRTMSFGTILVSVGLAFSANGNEPWHFCISFGFLFGIGLCLIGTVPFTTVLRNWFEQRRALAFSLLFLGSGASFAWNPAIAHLIGIVGWRNTFMVEAVLISACMLPLVVFVVRYHPREKGLMPDGISRVRTSHSQATESSTRIMNESWAATDWTLKLAFRTSCFWLVCLATFSIWGIMQHIMVPHHVAYACDIGYSKVYASSVLSLFGAFFAIGSLSGFISDRIGREPMMTIGTLVGISGIFVLMLMNDTSHSWMLFYYAAALGFGIGVSAPTIAASVTDIFQGPRVGSTIGFVWFSFAVGGTIGPWLGGWIFELYDGYEIAFIVAMGAYAVACVAIWLAAPRKVRLVPGRARKHRPETASSTSIGCEPS